MSYATLKDKINQLIKRSKEYRLYLPSMQTTGNWAFANCPEIITFEAPKATTIGESCFKQSKNLQVCIAPVCTRIENNAFSACNGLVRLEAPEVTYIGTNALNGTKLINAYLPKAVKTYGTEGNFLDSIHTLEWLTIGQGWNVGLVVKSRAIKPECLNFLIEQFANRTGMTPMTFNVGEWNINKIDDEHKAMAAAKNYIIK